MELSMYVSPGLTTYHTIDASGSGMFFRFPRELLWGGNTLSCKDEKLHVCPLTCEKIFGLVITVGEHISFNPTACIADGLRFRYCPSPGSLMSRSRASRQDPMDPSRAARGCRLSNNAFNHKIVPYHEVLGHSF